MADRCLKCKKRINDVYYTDITYVAIGISSRKLTYNEKCPHCIFCNIVYHKSMRNGRLTPHKHNVKLTKEQENTVRLYKIKKLKRKMKWEKSLIHHIIREIKSGYYHTLTHLKATLKDIYLILIQKD